MAPLVPVGLARYGLADRTVWFWSSIAFLALIVLTQLVYTQAIAPDQ